MDRFAISAANLLAGNAENTGGLECTVRAPRLRALCDCTVAVAGAAFEVLVDGRPHAAWESVAVRAGSELSLTRIAGGRAYIAVAGGFAADRWLGSVGTYLLAGKGGLRGRALRAGDILQSGSDEPPQPPRRQLPEDKRPRYSASPELMTVAGPHDSRLSQTSRRALFKEPFTLLPESDRMGFRLTGPELETKAGELLSFGTAFGCVQLTPAGPIVLMADHQTSGGYPVAGCVARSALPLAAQLVPGDSVRFVETKVEQAQRDWTRLRDGLDALRA